MREGTLRRKLARRLHLFSDDRASVVYDRQGFQAFGVDRGHYVALRRFLAGSDLSAACAAAGTNPVALAETVTAILAPPATSDAEASTEPEKPGLDRLVLNVSNDCNLRCLYCYAEGGAYGAPRGRMPEEVALASAARAVEFFGSIGTVQFFGGEPLLNVPVIDRVCRWFEEQAAAGVIDKLPRFGIVTNGTLLTEEAAAVLNRHNIASTVSLDGPRDVTDALRGEGTFDAVAAYVARMSGEGRIVDIESTFTKLHLDTGYDLPVVMEFLREEFGAREVHIPWVSLPPGHPLAIDEDELVASYTAGTRLSLQSMADGRPVILSLVKRMMDALSKHAPSQVYCPAGVNTLAVATDGWWYPCFMFVGRSDLRMFNAATGEGEDGQVEQVSQLIRTANDGSLQPCADCWARGLCSGCLGADLASTGDLLQKAGCEVRRAMAREVVIGAVSMCLPSAI